MLKNNHLTLRGVLKDGKTFMLVEDTEFPEFLPDVPVTVRIEFPAAKGVLRNGKTLLLEDSAAPLGDAPDVPVVVHIELPVGKGILQAYGVCKDDPDFDDIEKTLEALRHGNPLTPARP